MKDMMSMMKKAQELQSKMGDMHAELDNLEVEGEAGAGMVRITLTAKGMLRGIKIDPSLFNEADPEMLEDLIIAAHASAREKGEEAAKEKMADLTGGFGLPDGMKLPF